MSTYTQIHVPTPDGESYVAVPVTHGEARIIELLEEQVAAIERLTEAIEKLTPNRTSATEKE